MSYAVQRYDRKNEAWKNMYISSKKKTATQLMVDLKDLRPTSRYRVVAIKCAHPTIVFSEVINRKDDIEEVLLRR